MVAAISQDILAVCTHIKQIPRPPISLILPTMQCTVLFTRNEKREYKRETEISVVLLSCEKLRVLPSNLCSSKVPAKGR